jgi:hypothetical protein
MCKESWGSEEEKVGEDLGTEEVMVSLWVWDKKRGRSH